MGTPWRMFTKTQAEELISGTNSTWTTVNGKNGRKFINKKDSTKYIFLPAGGWWWETNLNDVGTNGYYWTNQYSTYPGSICISFSSANTSVVEFTKVCGLSVRAISTDIFQSSYKKV